jgi:hypothetical protein
MRPNFLVVGAMKAGTTWLADNLENHPQVFLPKKELHFFNIESNFKRGIDWYEKEFCQAGDAIAIGEKTAGYLLNEDTPGLIREFLPGVRILIVLRDPVDRAISQINHHIRSGHISPHLDPGNFLDSDLFSKMDSRFSIVERGRYLNQIKRYYEHFDEDRILIFINETDIRKTPELTLSKTCEFLRVNSMFDFPMKDKKIHANRNSKLGVSLGYKLPVLRPMIMKLDHYLPGEKMPPFQPSKSETQRLYEIYAEENQRLFEFLGQNMPNSWIY